MKQADLNNNQGFTLIEVMIAIMVLVIGLLGAGAMQLSSTQGNANASNMTEATNLAMEQIENILSWDATDARLDNLDDKNYSRIGILGAIGPGNNQIGVITTDPADNLAVFEDYTVYWDGTPMMDPGNPALQVGIDLQIYVVWNERGRLKTVAMNIVKYL